MGFTIFVLSRGLFQPPQAPVTALAAAAPTLEGARDFKRSFEGSLEGT